MIAQTRIRGKIYPDRSFSIGFCPRIKKKLADKKYDRDYIKQEEPNYGNLADWLTGINTIEGKFQSISESPLLVKSPKSSRKKRGVYGRHGITNFGRRFCKNACILLEQRYGIRRLGFATATLPAMDKDTCRFINGHISDITRRFYQKIRRIFEKRGQRFIYVGCVEIQEERFKNSSLPVPHIHFVYLAKRSSRSGYTVNVKECYQAWNASVNEVLKLFGRDEIMGHGGHKGSVKLEPISSSAAAYLGKYISKGSKVVEAMKEKGFEEFPKQWWTACMHCKEMFKTYTISMDANFALSLFYQLEHYLHEETVEWARFVDICIGGEYRTMGLVGTLSKDAYESLLDF